MAKKEEEYPDGHPLQKFRPVIVTGYRDWKDRAQVFAALDKIKATDGIDAIIVADEGGVAQFALDWAFENHLPTVVWPVDPADGEQASFRRAHRMLHRSKSASRLIAFPGGYVTDWLVANAKALYSIPVQLVKAKEK